MISKYEILGKNEKIKRMKNTWKTHEKRMEFIVLASQIPCVWKFYCKFHAFFMRISCEFHAFSMRIKHMEIAWKTHEIRMISLCVFHVFFMRFSIFRIQQSTNAWKTHEKRMEFTEKNSHEKRMEITVPIRMKNAWKTHEIYIQKYFFSHEKRMKNAWKTHEKRMWIFPVL